MGCAKSNDTIELPRCGGYLGQVVLKAVLMVNVAGASFVVGAMLEKSGRSNEGL